MDVVAMVLMLAGSLVVFLGALGLYRMPDLYHRMQASAKSSSLGAAFLLLAVAFYFGDARVTARAIAGIVFIFLTVPVAAHLVARTAHRMRVPNWSGTLFDELTESGNDRHEEGSMEIGDEDEEDGVRTTSDEPSPDR